MPKYVEVDYTPEMDEELIPVVRKGKPMYLVKKKGVLWNEYK